MIKFDMSLLEMIVVNVHRFARIGLFASVRTIPRFVAWLLVMSWICGSAQTHARERASVSLPQRGNNSVGFQLSLICDDVRLFGDTPALIQVSPDGGKFPADRSIIVRIAPTPRTTQPPSMNANYEIPLSLPEGSGAIAKQVYLPKWTVGGSFDIAILEGRRVLDGYQGRLSGLSMFPAQAEATWWESAKERFVWIVDPRAGQPDGRTFFATVAPELLNIGDIEKSSGMEFGIPWRQFEVQGIDSLPKDWRGFDAADVWIIESKTLANLMTGQRESSAALRAYLRCGGTLWVLGETEQGDLRRWFELVDANLQFERTQVTEAINLASLAFDYDSYRANSYQTSASSRAYLREMAVANAGGLGNLMQQNLQANVDARFEGNLAWFRVQELDGAQRQAKKDEFSVYPLALGRIVVCNSDDSVPGSPQQWRTLINLSDFDMSESLRRGVDPSFGDRRFWDWIIPNVAQPPVYTFIGLLCAFVIVVGPLAYRKFTKLGRGYLMMFVAPLLALMTTLVMFVYGLLADGLSTSTRVREVTWVADGSGAAARYCRSTYFAGVRPSEGMAFPENIVIAPYQLPSVGSWYEASQQDHSVMGTIRLESDAMKLDSGFLPSRQQKQFITYRPVENIGRLKLTATDDPSVMALESEMSLVLKAGTVRAADGRYFVFDQLAPKGKQLLKVITKAKASEQLSELYAVQRPLAPAAVSSSRRIGDPLIDMIVSLSSRNGPRQAITNRNTVGESSVEAWLRMSLQIESQIPPSTFIALADVTPDCVAVEGAELIESVHYVIGVLP